jgi:hypothetical protein
MEARMGTQNPVPAGPRPTAQDLQDLNDAYSDLLDHLNDAYWAASSLEAKDQLYGAIEATSDLVTQLEAADLTSRDSKYLTLVANVTNVNKQLETLQGKINSLISRINTSAAIVSDVAKVLALAGKLIPAV